MSMCSLFERGRAVAAVHPRASEGGLSWWRSGDAAQATVVGAGELDGDGSGSGSDERQWAAECAGRWMSWLWWMLLLRSNGACSQLTLQWSERWLSLGKSRGRQANRHRIITVFHVQI